MWTVSCRCHGCTCDSSPPLRVFVWKGSNLHTECVHDPIPIIHETRQNPFSDNKSSVKDTQQRSPVSSLMSNSTGASMSASNGPGLLSSAASVGLLSPTNSLGLQSTAYSPGIQSATNSPGLQSTACSPGLQSAAYIALGFNQSIALSVSQQPIALGSNLQVIALLCCQLLIALGLDIKPSFLSSLL